MRDALRSYLAVADELTKTPRRRAAALARTLAAQGGGVNEPEPETEDAALATLVRREIDRSLATMELATADEIRALSVRIAALEALQHAEADTVGDPQAVADAAGAAVDQAVHSARKVTATGRTTRTTKVAKKTATARRSAARPGDSA